MKRHVRFTLFTAAILALATFAWAEDAKTIEPEIAIYQVGGLPEFTNPGGPITVTYEIHVHNHSMEAIDLTRVNLQSVSPVTSYQLRNESRPYEVTIEPDTTEIVTYRALADARGGTIGAQTPVNLKGVVYFDSENGKFTKPFTHRVTPKGQDTDS